MNYSSFSPIGNGQSVPLAEVPVLSIEEFRESALMATESGARIVSLFGRPVGDAIRLYAVLAGREEGALGAISADAGESYPALTPDCAQAHWFEREIAEQWGVRPEGHPWLKPIRFQPPMRPGRDVWNRGGKIVVGDTNDRIRAARAGRLTVRPVKAHRFEPWMPFRTNTPLLGDLALEEMKVRAGRSQ